MSIFISVVLLEYFYRISGKSFTKSYASHCCCSILNETRNCGLNSQRPCVLDFLLQISNTTNLPVSMSYLLESNNSVWISNRANTLTWRVGMNQETLFDSNFYCFQLCIYSSFARLRHVVSSHSDVIWNYVSYRQLIGLLGREMSHVARLLPGGGEKKQKKTQSVFRTHHSSVRAGESTLCLRLRDHCD
jgi:hypothetical protein